MGVKRIFLVAAGAALLAPVVAGAAGSQAVAELNAGTPAAARPQCIYLVRDVSSSQGIYTGEFLVLRRTGSALKGYGGAFYSEGYNVKGSVAGSRATLNLQDPYDRSWSRVVRQWVVSQNRLAGWTKITKAKMKRYSGGYVPASGQLCS